MNRAVKKSMNNIGTIGFWAIVFVGAVSWSAELCAQEQPLLAPILMEDASSAPSIDADTPVDVKTAVETNEEETVVSPASITDGGSVETGAVSVSENAFQSEDSARITPEMAARFERLEAETRRLREEVARLNEKKSRTADVSRVSEPASEPVSAPASEPASASQTNTAEWSETQSQEEVASRREVDEYIERHIKDNAWRVGPMKITPYGKIWASMLVTTSRMASGDFIGNVLPNDSYGQTSFNVQARTSRLGLNVEGPDLCNGSIKSSGIVEVDFVNQTSSENKGALQLREAYWQLYNENFKLLLGQTKDVILPLYSNMFDYNALYAMGNPGYRNPMASFTRYYYPDKNVRMELTTALSMVCGGDFSAYDAPGTYPTVQSRVGWSIARPNLKTPIQFGFSGHIGEQRYNFPENVSSVSSWSANFDLVYPITDRLSVRGEFFHGQSMAGFFGGAYQNIDYDPVSRTGTRKGIHTTGGWGEIVWRITDKLQYAVGLGIDDPHNTDMEVASVERNGMYYTNFAYDFTRYFRSGVMYAYVMTDYRDGNPGGDKGRAHTFEWMWQISF